jgi:DNA-binding transcriptional regulator YiaG
MHLRFAILAPERLQKADTTAGEQIKAARGILGCSRKVLADHIGVARSTVSAFELGVARRPLG